MCGSLNLRYNFFIFSISWKILRWTNNIDSHVYANDKSSFLIRDLNLKSHVRQVYSAGDNYREKIGEQIFQRPIFEIIYYTIYSLFRTNLILIIPFIQYVVNIRYSKYRVHLWNIWFLMVFLIIYYYFQHCITYEIQYTRLKYFRLYDKWF